MLTSLRRNTNTEPEPWTSPRGLFCKALFPTRHMVFQQFRVSGAVFTYGTQKPHPLFCADFRLVLRAPALVAESLSLYPFPEACRSLHLNSKLSPNPSNREVWTINVYPYFDPGNHLDPGSASKCNQSLAKAGKALDIQRLVAVRSP